MPEKEEQYRQALAWILAEKGRTAGMAVKLTNAGSIQWPEVNRCTLISRLAKCKATGQGQYTSGNEKRAALLDYEKQNLLNEIKRRSDQGAPMSRTDMRRYIRSLLRVRKSQTMRHKSSYTAAAIPLNDAAMNILNSEDVDKLPSNGWFRKLLGGEAAQSMNIKEKKETRQDSDRAKNLTFSVAREHVRLAQRHIEKLPTVDEQGKVVECAEEQAIFNRKKGRFQSGDPVFMKRVADAQDELHLRECDVDRARTAKACAPFIQQKEALVAQQQELVDALIREDIRRGKARLMNHDECPAFICFDGRKGTSRQKVAVAGNNLSARNQAHNRESFSLHCIADANGAQASE